MPGALAGFTIVTADIEGAVQAYRRFLGYRDDGLAPIEADAAARWGAPALAGRRQAVMRPRSGHARFIRFVEQAGAAEYRPLGSFGWNAIEIVVRDLDAVAADLAMSPFRVLGAPETLDLGFTDRIRAMQVEGPSGEVLYLTEIDGPIPGFDLPVAQSDVDCAFVAVLGAASLPASMRFYGELFDVAPGPTLQARIACLSAAHGLPPAMRHALATVALPDGSLIEIDAYPTGAAPIMRTPCGLPAGIAFVSFQATTVDVADRMATGPDGECIEIMRHLSPDDAG